MLTLALYFAAATLTVVGSTGLLLGRIRETPAYGMCAAGCLIVVVADAIGGPTPLTSVWAAGAAYHGWQWWNSGGGDDTKRRMKRWGRRFQGVRRTAPQGA
ncbi:hypothetical protein [Streptomyces alfalfae]